MVCGVNPLKILGSKELVPRLGQTLDGWRKTDGLVMKKLPVEVDVPNYLVKVGLAAGSTDFTKGVGDLVMIAFYYLLRVGEYTVKSTRNSSKRTVQFRGQDVTFFKEKDGKLVQLDRGASEEEILTADSATLKLDNQKNGWQGVCVNHWTNGDSYFCPVRALWRRIVHLRRFGGSAWESLNLSAVFVRGKKVEVSDKDIRVAIKLAAAELDYPSRGIPVDRVDTHSLRCGGANALSLAGYSDRHIQKLGRWRGETFKEYVKEQLSNFSAGMSKSMKKMFGFVNVEGGVYQDATRSVMARPYENTGAAAA